MSDAGGSSVAPLEVTTRFLVAGGSAIATAPDGRVALIEGALPDERVVVEVPVARRRMLSGHVDRVLEASPHRIVPPCPVLAAGCGGCDLQFADAAQLPHMKQGMVVDALRRLGRVPQPVVEVAPALPPWGFRTTVRTVADLDGRPGFRRRRSHQVVAPHHCMVAHPLVDEVLAAGRFPPGSAVMVRASVATGDRLVVTDAALAEVSVPPGVSVLGGDGATGATWLRERVGGRWWRVSGTSFFQARPDGADELVAQVNSAVALAVSAGLDVAGTAVDAYAGVGLFAGALRDRGWTGPLVAVERHGPATADAAANLATDGVEVVTTAFERWSPEAASLVVADPARAGLGRPGAEVVAATGTGAVVLVSCDVASLGRDVALLGDHGLVHVRSVVVDMFPHTHHVEVVTLLLGGELGGRAVAGGSG